MKNHYPILIITAIVILSCLFRENLQFKIRLNMIILTTMGIIIGYFCMYSKENSNTKYIILFIMSIIYFEICKMIPFEV